MCCPTEEPRLPLWRWCLGMLVAVLVIAGGLVQVLDEQGEAP